VGFPVTYIRVRYDRAVSFVHLFFLINEPHQRFSTVIEVAAVPDSPNETYSIGLQNPFTQHLIACRSDLIASKNINIIYLHKLSPKHSTSLL